MHIPTYYNVIGYCNHDWNDLWGFFIDPPSFGYNSAEQENPILCILRFTNLHELKFNWNFLELIFYDENHMEKKKSTRWAPEAKWAQVARAPGQAAPPMPI
jgi:hypothetical protein